MTRRLRISPLRACAIVAGIILCLGAARSGHAQGLETTITVAVTPNPATSAQPVTFSANVQGISQTPTGTVSFSLSNSSLCDSDVAFAGSATLDGSGNATFPSTGLPGGQYDVCASYSGDGLYEPETTSPAQEVITIYGAAVTVTGPGSALQNQPVSLTATVTAGPAGAPAPTGSVTLTDESTGTTYGPFPITGVPATATIPLSNLAPGDHPYFVTYSGDANYAAGNAIGGLFIQVGLLSVNPGAVVAGSPDTPVTLIGQGFTSGSVAQLALDAGNVNLTTTYVSATKLQAVIPAASLATVGADPLQVQTSGTTTNVVQLDVYTKFTDTVSVQANPAIITYGQTGQFTFGAEVTRGAAADAAVPSGGVTFSVDGGTAFQSTGQLGEIATPGIYQAGTGFPIDDQSLKILSADLNGDGYQDPVSINVDGSPYLQVFLSAGPNTFQTEAQIFAGCDVQDFAIGDLNKDGIPDVIVACFAGSSEPYAFYLLGNGDGSFQAPVVIAASGNSNISTPTQIAVGDFNGDGNLDVALIDATGDLQVFNGSGPFTGFTAQAATTFSVTTGAPVNLVAADFNQDGKSDLALLEYNGDSGSGAVLVLTSGANGTFTTQQLNFTSPSFGNQGLTVTDVNGDGFPDVVVADPGQEDNETDSGQLLIYENNGAGQLNAAFSYAAANAASATGIPFPSTGKPAAASKPAWSIFYSTVDPDSGAISLTALQRQSATAYTVAYTDANVGFAQSFDDSGTNIVPIAVGDWNGDGYLDVLLNNLPNGESDASQLQPAFYGNDAALTLIAPIPALTAGTHNLVASYSGDVNFAAGNSPAFQITVNQSLPTVSVTGPATSSFGQSVTFTATVTGVAGGTSPSGTVQFYYDGDTPLGAPQTLVPGTTNSTAQVSTATFAIGTHEISALYSGDPNYLSTSSSQTQVIVGTAAFTLSLTSSASTATAGTVVEFDVQATGPGALPVGQTITFTGLPTPAAAPTLSANGVAVYRFGLFTPGQYTIQAQYGGSADIAATASNTITLNVTAIPVSVTLLSSANPVAYPGTFNLTAIASAAGLGVPTGTVSFLNNGAVIGNGSLSVVNGASGLNLVGSFDTAPEEGQNIAVATGDFNKDGNQDVAVLQANSDNVVTLLVSLGNGDGTFATPVTYTSDEGVDQNAFALVAGDFNRDGYSDLAILGADGGLTTFLSTADGSGQLQRSQTIEIPISEAGQALAVGDFNHDGNPDLAIASDSNISVFLGAGSGGNGTVFPTSPSFQYQGAFSPSGIVAADFNQDGYSDLAVSNAQGSTVSVLLYNPQTANFTAQTYPAGESASAIAAVDFNKDTYPDLAVVSGGDSTVSILLNNQQGGFQPGISYATATEPVSIVSGDFNGDGYGDFAISGVGGGQGGGTSILFGGPVTGSTTTTNAKATLLPQVYGQAAAVADFNGDLNPDLIVAFTSVTAYLDSSTQVVVNNIALPGGTYPLTATYTPAAGTNFAAATSSILNQVVTATGPTITSITPASAYLGAAATPVTLTGTGFLSTSVVQLNGAPIPTTFVSQTQLQATIPSSFFQVVQSGTVTVTNPGGATSAGIAFNSTAPPLQVVLTGPSTTPSGSQPAIVFQLPTAYPVAITGTFTLSVQPSTPGGPIDPSVQFSTGGDTFTFTLPANTTTTPTVQFQAGTISGSITLTLTLQAGGIDITPASLTPLVIQVPPSAPTLESLAVTRNGTTLTVTILGFSNTREMKSAAFNFTAASGDTVTNPSVSVDLGSSFTTWYGQAASDQYGSSFTYVQTFLLTDDASTIGTVSGTLVNSVGDSNTKSNQ